MILYKLSTSNTLLWWKIEQNGSEYTIAWGKGLQTIDTCQNTVSFYSASTPEKAAQEIDSRIREQIHRKGYSKEIPEEQPNLPMLAQKWTDHLATLKSGTRQPFPNYFVQPKLDGLRCLGTNTEITTRRLLKITSCPHIAEVLKTLPDNYKLDGELYIHGETLQTIQSLTRKRHPVKMSYRIEYHVFDLVDTELPFEVRHVILQDIVQQIKDHFDSVKTIAPPSTLIYKGECPVKLVPTKQIEPEGVEQQLQDAIQDGMEGIIIRNGQGLYQLNHRSPDLLKHKVRQDDDFKIVDVVKGHDDVGVFVCITNDGKIFNVSPKWTKDKKRWLARNPDKYIGRTLTVQYERLSDEMIPLKPVGIVVRQDK